MCSVSLRVCVAVCLCEWVGGQSIASPLNLHNDGQAKLWSIIQVPWDLREVCRWVCVFVCVCIGGALKAMQNFV